mmetsp:Transcript_51662/g.112570  ORF Transcript_51662/g.112570 Transcript_51662/m.112570 type:complete len:206 (-) Transcript_51662:715-1332(-)
MGGLRACTLAIGPVDRLASSAYGALSLLILVIIVVIVEGLTTAFELVLRFALAFVFALSLTVLSLLSFTVLSFAIFPFAFRILKGFLSFPVAFFPVSLFFLPFQKGNFHCCALYLCTRQRCKSSRGALWVSKTTAGRHRTLLLFLCFLFLCRILVLFSFSGISGISLFRSLLFDLGLLLGRFLGCLGHLQQLQEFHLATTVQQLF